MKRYRNFIIFAICAFSLIFGNSCSHKVGCPSNGKNVGAERILSGEKVPKARKFKS
jgi:hypothetical protein